MSFCPFCGKQLADGEVCACQQSQSSPAPQSAINTMPPQTDSVPPQPTFNTMPQQVVYSEPQAGQPIYQPQPQYTPQPVQPSQPPEIFGKILGYIKGFFSTGVEDTVSSAGVDNGLAWLIFGGVYLLVAGLALMLNYKGMFGAAESYMKYMGLSMGKMFVIGLLYRAVSFFATVTGVFVFAKICKANLTYINVANMTAVAFLPLGIAGIANCILGFIYFPLVIVTNVVALAVTTMLIYSGIKNVIAFKKSLIWGYSVVIAAIVLVVCIVLGIIFKIALNDLFDSINSLSSFGGLLY